MTNSTNIQTLRKQNLIDTEELNLCDSINKPKMAYSRDLAVMDCHGMDDFHGQLSWMTLMDYCLG